MAKTFCSMHPADYNHYFIYNQNPRHELTRLHFCVGPWLRTASTRWCGARAPSLTRSGSASPTSWPTRTLFKLSRNRQEICFMRILYIFFSISMDNLFWRPPFLCVLIQRLYAFLFNSFLYFPANTVKRYYCSEYLPLMNMTQALVTSE